MPFFPYFHDIESSLQLIILLTGLLNTEIKDTVGNSGHNSSGPWKDVPECSNLAFWLTNQSLTNLANTSLILNIWSFLMEQIKTSFYI